jgi:hypothetical protein
MDIRNMNISKTLVIITWTNKNNIIPHQTIFEIFVYIDFGGIIIF